jgi:hypothetical protein
MGPESFHGFMSGTTDGLGFNAQHGSRVGDVQAVVVEQAEDHDLSIGQNVDGNGVEGRFAGFRRLIFGGDP